MLIPFQTGYLEDWKLPTDNVEFRVAPEEDFIPAGAGNTEVLASGYRSVPITVANYTDSSNFTTLRGTIPPITLHTTSDSNKPWVRYICGIYRNGIEVASWIVNNFKVAPELLQAPATSVSWVDVELLNRNTVPETLGLEAYSKEQTLELLGSAVNTTAMQNEIIAARVAISDGTAKADLVTKLATDYNFQESEITNLETIVNRPDIFTRAGLPAPTNSRRIVALSDDIRGLWIDTGIWHPLSAGLMLEWFGGGTDGRDNTQPFIDAIAALQAAGGGKIVLNIGTYTCSAAIVSIILTTAIVIEGLSSDRQYGSRILLSGANKKLFTIGIGIRSIGFSRVCLLANTTTGTKGISMSGNFGQSSSFEFLFDDVVFVGFNKAVEAVDTVSGGWQIDNVNFRHCRFFSNTIGVYLNSANADYWKFDHVQFGGIPQDGYGVYTDKTGFLIFDTIVCTGQNAGNPDSSTWAAAGIYINGVRELLRIAGYEGEGIRADIVLVSGEFFNNVELINGQIPHVKVHDNMTIHAITSTFAEGGIKLMDNATSCHITLEECVAGFFNGVSNTVLPPKYIVDTPPDTDNVINIIGYGGNVLGANTTFEVNAQRARDSHVGFNTAPYSDSIVDIGARQQMGVKQTLLRMGLARNALAFVNMGSGTGTDTGDIIVDTTVSNPTFDTAGLLIIEPNTANEEIVSYTGLTGTTFTGIGRARIGTTVINHADNSVILSLDPKLAYFYSFFRQMELPSSSSSTPLAWLGVESDINVTNPNKGVNFLMPVRAERIEVNGSIFKFIAIDGSGNSSDVITWTVGTGSPEGVLTANPSSRYSRKDTGDEYVKKTGTGNTGWKLVTLV